MEDRDAALYSTLAEVTMACLATVENTNMEHGERLETCIAAVTSPSNPQPHNQYLGGTANLPPAALRPATRATRLVNYRVISPHFNSFIFLICSPIHPFICRLLTMGGLPRIRKCRETAPALVSSFKAQDNGTKNPRCSPRRANK